MHAIVTTPDELLETAIAAARLYEVDALDHLPAAIYTTNAEGRITYFNQACVDFSGRTPKVGRDSWCVSWKLYTEDGEYLPHDQCPMAVAIREKQPVRGVAAIAERPDGSRVNFVPYPTPLLDDDGELIGAVNILIDMTEPLARAEHYRSQALRCRRLAHSMGDRQTSGTLILMADEYEQKAREVQRDN
jgi:PAS domain-containing protein